MIKKLFILSLALLFLRASSKAENQCYLIVEKSGDYNPKSISDFTVPLVSRYIEPVRKPGFGGVRAKDCHYSVSLSESKEGIAITISGRKAAAFGDTKDSGMKGVKQALLRAVYRAAPDKKREICDLYSTIIPEDCGVAVKKREPEKIVVPQPIRPTPMTPRPVQPQKPVREVMSADYEVIATRFFEGGKKAPKSSDRVYKTRFSKRRSRYIYTELKVNNLQYKGIDHEHDVIWLYYNPNGSLRGRIAGTFKVKPKWATAWIYRGWGWADYGNWPVGTYRVKLFVDGVKVEEKTFAIY